MIQSPDSNKGPHGSTYVIAVVAGSTPAYPDWSSIQSIHVELLDPETFLNTRQSLGRVKETEGKLLRLKETRFRD